MKIVFADVYENKATNNTGGNLVFDLLGLNLKNSNYVRIFKNRVKGNNHKNFAQPGALALGAGPCVPPGLKLSPLGLEKSLLARTQRIRGVKVVAVLGVSFENHQVLVIKDQIGSFVVL